MYSSINITELFHKVLLTASYYLDLQEAIEHIFGEVNSTHYIIVDVADNIFKFGKKLYKEITKVDKK